MFGEPRTAFLKTFLSGFGFALARVTRNDVEQVLVPPGYWRGELVAVDRFDGIQRVMHDPPGKPMKVSQKGIRWPSVEFARAELRNPDD